MHIQRNYAIILIIRKEAVNAKELGTATILAPVSVNIRPSFGTKFSPVPQIPSFRSIARSPQHQISTPFVKEGPVSKNSFIQFTRTATIIRPKTAAPRFSNYVEIGKKAPSVLDLPKHRYNPIYQTSQVTAKPDRVNTHPIWHNPQIPTFIKPSISIEKASKQPIQKIIHQPGEIKTHVQIYADRKVQSLPRSLEVKQTTLKAVSNPESAIKLASAETPKKLPKVEFTANPDQIKQLAVVKNVFETLAQTDQKKVVSVLKHITTQNPLEIRRIVTEITKPLTRIFEHPNHQTQLVTLTEQTADLEQASVSYNQLLKAGIQPLTAKEVISKSLKTDLAKTTFENIVRSPAISQDKQSIEEQLISEYKLTIFQKLKVKKVVELIQFVRDEDLNKQRLQSITKAAQAAEETGDELLYGPNILAFLPPDQTLRSQVAKEYDGSLENIKSILAQTDFKSLGELNMVAPALVDQNSAIKIELNSVSEVAEAEEIKKVFEGLFYRDELLQILARLIRHPQSEISRLAGQTNLQAA